MRAFMKYACAKIRWMAEDFRFGAKNIRENELINYQS